MNHIPSKMHFKAKKLPAQPIYLQSRKTVETEKPIWLGDDES